MKLVRFEGGMEGVRSDASLRREGKRLSGGSVATTV